ncbi:hypothetical protein KAI52_01040, partial [Candidatus Parcubacteria bacterium]|nr:hypothetical protein [Candidatus Parcubacteria bacterium]
MKKIFLLFIATICIISGCTINKQNINNNNTLDLSNDKNKKTVFLNENWKESQSPYSDSVVCTFKISAVTDFEKDHISGEVNVSDKPMTLTFVDIAADSPSIIGNLGDKATLLKIDNGSIVYLIEKTDFGN